VSRSLPSRSPTLELLNSFPIYRRVLELAVAHEERELHSPNYMGWRWNDVEVHPTRLMRLVTDGISRINLRTRKATYYLLKDRAEVKRALGKNSVEIMSDHLKDSTTPHRGSDEQMTEDIL
jgi:hypothetical protein